MTETVLDYAEEIITPELAKAYLGLNTKNRRKRDRRIESYARDMRAGSWVMTGEAIKFAPSGRLLDGQNRLSAVIEAGIPVRMSVLRNVPESAMPLMDAGIIRNRADAVYLEGLVANPSNAKDLAAAVVVHRAWGLGELTNVASKPGRNASTNAEAVEHAIAHPGLAAAAEFGRKMYHHLRLPLGAYAVAKMEFDAIDPEASADFFDRIATMRTEGKGDPIATLFRRVGQEHEAGKGVRAGLALFFLFRAWNAYRDGEPLTKFQIGSARSGWYDIPTPH